ncbi:Uncharacterised protein [Mycobacteroides abscessus subsp. abscessus]|nr:Uncharacterised protein [Mycobacteroides abscessus subsp. abscessus]SHW28896.1 Uncharacterised protein [Mycobacteroides abscessus subsp. abscessus]
MTPASTPYPAYRLPDGLRSKSGLYGFPAFSWCTFFRAEIGVFADVGP